MKKNACASPMLGHCKSIHMLGHCKSIHKGVKEENLGEPTGDGKNKGSGSLQENGIGVMENAKNSHMSLYNQPPNVNIHKIKFIHYPAPNPHDHYLSRIYLI
jgi:hypothetical protein